MTWLDPLTTKALARELPTRAELLEVVGTERHDGREHAPVLLEHVLRPLPKRWGQPRDHLRAGVVQARDPERRARRLALRAPVGGQLWMGGRDPTTTTPVPLTLMVFRPGLSVDT